MGCLSSGVTAAWLLALGCPMLWDPLGDPQGGGIHSLSSPQARRGGIPPWHHQ